MRTNISLLGAAAALLALPLFAQPPSNRPSSNQPSSNQPSGNPFQGMIRFTGTVKKLDGQELSVESQDGVTTMFELPDGLAITKSTRATMNDLRSGKFVGCTAVTGSGGKLRATECHIFPESMRGRGEGHNPMGPPNTTMTNGNITTMTNGDVESAEGVGGAGLVLHVTYRGGAQDIEVSPETQITEIAAGDKSLLKPGVMVNGAAREVDGARRVQFLNITP